MGVSAQLKIRHIALIIELYIQVFPTALSIMASFLSANYYAGNTE